MLSAIVFPSKQRQLAGKWTGPQPAVNDYQKTHTPAVP